MIFLVYLCTVVCCFGAQADEVDDFLANERLPPNVGEVDDFLAKEPQPPDVDEVDEFLANERLPPDVDEVDHFLANERLPPDVEFPRIVGGQEAFIEDHPYQVSFIVNNSYFCGGFIVNQCQLYIPFSVDPSTVVLRAGSASRKNGTIIEIARVTPHPGWDNPAFDKDVAVMETKSPIEFTDVIQPIALPPENRSMVGGTIISVSGWGRTQQGAPTIPERLMDVVIEVVSMFKCSLVYSSVLTDNMFCAGNFWFGGKGTCQGDSGGAAVQDGFAVGVVSFGRGCAQPLSPSVFADIAAPDNRRFIKEQTGL